MATAVTAHAAIMLKIINARLKAASSVVGSRYHLSTRPDAMAVIQVCQFVRDPLLARFRFSGVNGGKLIGGFGPISLV